MENVNCIFVIVCVHYRIHVLIKKEKSGTKKIIHVALTVTQKKKFKTLTEWRKV